MANFYTDVAAAQLAAETNLANLQKDGGLLTNPIRATWTIAGTETASDFVYICKLPKGSRVRPHLCQIIAEACGTAVTGNVGDAADVDRYGSAIALAAGGSFALDELTTAPLADYKTGDHADDTGWIIFDPTTITSSTAGKKVVFEIFFTQIK